MAKDDPLDGLLVLRAVGRATSPPLDRHWVGNTVLATDVEAPWLRAFRVGEEDEAVSKASVVEDAYETDDGDLGEDAREVFDGLAELAGAHRRVLGRWSADGTKGEVDIEIGPELGEPELAATQSRGRWLHCRIDEPSSTITYRFSAARPRELPELLLGSPLLLALALRGTFCLHASAWLQPSGAVVFLGSSGAGKSTLARELATRGQTRIADDLLLLRAGGRSPVALPRFPQPRLDPREQPAAAPREVPVAAIYLLGGHEPTARGEPVAPAAATLAIARHTVASRLFDSRLMERHLAFAAGLAAAVPVRVLRYPWRPGGVEEAAEAIRDDLASAASAGT